MRLVNKVKDNMSNERKKVIILYLSQILMVLCGVITSSIHTRFLGPADFGVLTFFYTFISYSVLFFRFGFFSSGSVLLAEVENAESERELIGSLFIVGILIGLSYSVFIYISSFYVDQIFGTNINHILRKVSLLATVYPFAMLIAAISKGTNKVYHVAFFNVAPKAIYIVVVILLISINHISIINLVISLLIVNILCTLIVIIYFKPIFKNVKMNMRNLLTKNKEYGSQLYLGQIADQATFKLDGILISYFVNTTQLGFYNLATLISSPMVLLSQALSTTIFKKMRGLSEIPKKALLFNLWWSIGCAIFLIIFSKYIIVILFSSDFLEMLNYFYLLVLAAVFQSLYQPYSSFLAAHQKGKWLKRASFVMAFSNLLGNVILIPIYGVYGAVVSCIMGAIVYYLLCRYYYHLTVKEIKTVG